MIKNVLTINNMHSKINYIISFKSYEVIIKINKAIMYFPIAPNKILPGK